MKQVQDFIRAKAETFTWFANTVDSTTEKRTALVDQSLNILTANRFGIVPTPYWVDIFATQCEVLFDGQSFPMPTNIEVVFANSKDHAAGAGHCFELGRMKFTPVYREEFLNKPSGLNFMPNEPIRIFLMGFEVHGYTWRSMHSLGTINEAPIIYPGGWTEFELMRLVIKSS